MRNHWPPKDEWLKELRSSCTVGKDGQKSQAEQTNITLYTRQKKLYKTMACVYMCSQSNGQEFVSFMCMEMDCSVCTV